MNIAIVGCGTIFKYVYHGIKKNPNYKLVALCDQEINRIKKFRGSYDIYTSYTAMAKNLAHDTLIVILVSHTIRANILNYFLKEKFKVICEKPLFWKKEQCTQILWPYVLYHRAFNEKIPLIAKFINAQKSYIKSINMIYYEDISKQTTGTEYRDISDLDGGGCINDNLPNCMSVLDRIFDSPIVFKSVTKEAKNGITTKANVNLLINNINCDVKLSWQSQVDEKSIIIKTNKGHYLFDLQSGYLFGKDSLYKEYENCFNYFSFSDNSSKRTSYRILKVLDKINSIK